MTTVDSQEATGETPSARPADVVRDAAKADVVVRVAAPHDVVVALVGEHDLRTAPLFEERALQRLEECDRLTVDLSDTTFLDSTVLKALLRIAQHAHWRGVDIRVAAPAAGAAHRLLEVTGLAQRLCLVSLESPPTATRPPNRT